MIEFKKISFFSGAFYGKILAVVTFLKGDGFYGSTPCGRKGYLADLGAAGAGGYGAP
jgi:hypothetical protein